MANLSYAFRENALNAYRNDIRRLDSKSSERPQRTEERSQAHSSQLGSSHGNLHHACHTPLKNPGTNSLHHDQQGSMKQRQSIDPYLMALTKETCGKTKHRYSSTDYLMQCYKQGLDQASATVGPGRSKNKRRHISNMGSGKKSEVIQDFDIANDLEVIQCPRCGILLSLCWEKCEKMYKQKFKRCALIMA